MQANFSFLQYAILVLYVGGTLCVGMWFARSQKSVEGYYLAGRSAPWWAVAISIVSADNSAISYLGCAAIVFSADMQMIVSGLAFPIAALFTALIFVPTLARQGVFSVYEYLGHRFNRHVRSMASVLFLLMRGSHLSVSLFAASLVLTQVVGLPIWGSLLVLGGLTTTYTVFGGMKAVLWTDVMQFFILIGGLIAVLVGVSMAFHWDLAEIWHLASGPIPANAPWLHGQPDEGHHTRLFHFALDLRQMTFPAVFLSLFFQGVGAYGCDQVLVQRYLSAGSKKQMVISLLTGSVLVMPVNILLFGTGVFMLAYYSHFLSTPGHEWVSTLADSNRVMSHFIIHGLPPTLGALVIAGLFAGTMSSFSAGLNSLSTSTYVDFVDRFTKKGKSEKTQVRLAMVVTFAWGAVTTLCASLLGGTTTIFEIINRVTSPFAAPLLGVFLLGMMSKRATALGAIGGGIVGAVATLLVTYGTTLHWLWYFVVGTVVSVISGYLLSFIPQKESRHEPLVGRPAHPIP